MINTYELTIDGRLKPVESAGFSSAFVKDGSPRWVRMVGPQKDELHTCLRALRLPEFLLEKPQGGDIRAGVFVQEGVLLATLPVLVQGEARFLGLRPICTATTLVTAEEEALWAIDRVVADLCAKEPQAETTLPGLLLEILEAVLRSHWPAYLSLRRSLDELAKALEEDPMGVPAEALLALKRRVGELSILCEDQGYCIVELRRGHSILSQSEMGRDRLRDLVSDADRRLKLMARLEDRVRDLRLHHLHCLQEATSRRLNVLAVLSAIYLPATLIAGIYGMNFEGIPITHVPCGYFIVMLLMAAVVLGQFWYFNRRGWFK
jgi:magnesium transporter